MLTTLLFAHYLQEERCLCLQIDQQGQIIANPQQHNFEEIRQLQEHSFNLVVLPTHYFSLHRVELPLLSDKKARIALPYALEDQLAQNVNDLHFAFDRRFYINGHYLIAVCNKSYILEIVNKLTEVGIDFDAITIDWFALLANESCVLHDYLLINNENFIGALSKELAPIFFSKKLSDEHKIYLFSDSGTIPEAPAEIQTDEMSAIWLAKRLHKATTINLCQGDILHKSTKDGIKRWIIIGTAMCMIWLISLIGVNIFKLYTFNKKITDLDSKIAVLYHQFFPEAKQVINPKLRINQLLKSQKNLSDVGFWSLIDKLSLVAKETPITIEQLRFQNASLLVTLATKDFDTLETLQDRLEQNQISVKQTEASKRNELVVSTLELKL